MFTSDHSGIGMPFARYLGVFYLLILGISACGCTQPGAGQPSVLSILSYNVQTLFDDTDDGTEFGEYSVRDGGWNRSSYHARLRNLSRVIRESIPGGADVLILQEVENSSVLEDLVWYFLRDLGYRYSSMSREAGQAFGQGIISRYPLENVRSISVTGGEGSRLRPLLEAEIRTDSDDPMQRVMVYALHWKSKRGDSDDNGARLRLLQANALTQALARLPESLPVIVAGDFNEPPSEYTTGLSHPTALVRQQDWPDWYAEHAYTGFAPIILSNPPERRLTTDPPYGPEQGPDQSRASQALLTSDLPRAQPARNTIVPGPVAEADFSTTVDVWQHFWNYIEPGWGSYHYSGSWEQIDNILFRMPDGLPGYQVQAGLPCFDFLIGSSGKPRKYQASGGYGYSDHLPLLMVLQW